MQFTGAGFMLTEMIAHVIIQRNLQIQFMLPLLLVMLDYLMINSKIQDNIKGHPDQS